MIQTNHFSHKSFLLILLFASILSACAQNPPKYKEIVVKIPGTITDYFLPENKLTGVLVEIVQGGKVIYSQKTIEGKYILTAKMDISKKFYIRYTQKDYLSKQISIDFKEDSLQKLRNWSDTIVPFEDLSIELPYSSLFKKTKQPVLVAEFTMAKQVPSLNISKAKETKQMLENTLQNYSGEVEFFYKKGKPKAFIRIKNGKLEGESIWWNPDGSVLKKANFMDGVEVK